MPVVCMSELQLQQTFALLAAFSSVFLGWGNKSRGKVVSEAQALTLGERIKDPLLDSAQHPTVALPPPHLP